MSPWQQLVEVASSPGATVIALDPLAATTVPMPPELGLDAAEMPIGTSSLELLDPASHGAAVVAFDRARRCGSGTAVVRVAGLPNAMRLHLFDLAEQHGVLISVTCFVDADVEIVEATQLPARRAIASVTLGGVFEEIDAAFTELFGWTGDEVVGEPVLAFVHPDDHEASLVAWAEVMNPDVGTARVRQRFRCRDGSWLWCEVTDERDEHGPAGVIVNSEMIDVSREIAAHAALQRRETMLDRLYRALPTSVVVLEVDGTVAVENEQWSALFGQHPLGPYDALLERCAEPEQIVGALDRSIRGLSDADLHVDLNDGSCRHADLHIRPLVEGGVHVGTLLTADETTAIRHHADDLAGQMRRDTLTGALNRLGVREHIEMRLATPGRLAVLYVDLDGFKHVNDTHGHQVGDQVLRAAVAGISAAMRDDDLVGRVGGDEFVVVLDTAPDDAVALAGRLREAIFAHTGTAISGVGLDASVGMAVRVDGDDFDSLIDRADRMMYAEKARRRSVEQRRPISLTPAGGAEIAGVASSP